MSNENKVDIDQCPDELVINLITKTSNLKFTIYSPKYIFHN